MKKLFFFYFLCAACAILSAQTIPATVVGTVPEVLCAGDSARVDFVLNGPVQPNQPFKVCVWLTRQNITLMDTVFDGLLSNLTVVDTLQIGYVYGAKFKVPVQTPPGTWFASGNINSPNQFNFTVNQCSKSPCDTVPALAHSALCHTFCTYNTYNLNQSMCNAIRVSGQNLDSTSYVFYTSYGAPTATPSIIFTPSLSGVYSFTLTGSMWVNGQRCFQYTTWSFTVVACQYTITDVGIKEEFLSPENIEPKYFTLDGRPTSPAPNTLLIEQRGLYRRKVILQN